VRSSAASHQHPSPQQVGESYDRLDEIYRNRSVSHVHHGLWLHGNETRQQAKEQLATWAADCLALKSGDRCVDIGSGYGEMARQVAKVKNVSVTAITSSALQHERALKENTFEAVEYRLGDWCSNDLPPGEYDAAWAIESLEHMKDLDLALSQCRRVLKPGGRMILLSWLAGDRACELTEAALLAPLVKDAHLAPLRTGSEIMTSLSRAGFEHPEAFDLTSKVKRTWAPTGKGLLFRLGLISEDSLEPALAWRTVRIALAYNLKALSYWAISAQAPYKSRQPADDI